MLITTTWFIVPVPIYDKVWLQKVQHNVSHGSLKYNQTDSIYSIHSVLTILNTMISPFSIVNMIWL